jgi:hypothetical protein
MARGKSETTARRGVMSETDEDRTRHYRREHALWALEGMMQWCLEHGDERQLEALTNLEVVLNELMVENAKLRTRARDAR